MGHPPDRLIPHLRHLSVRFFDVLRSRPLSPTEQQRVSSLLRPAEAPLFWAQPVADQRHGLASADHLAEQLPGRSDLQRAALLHDVAKRHARLGVMGRTFASLSEILRMRVGGRVHVYLDHGPIGAEELAAAGAEEIVVEFTRAHHGARPESIHEDDWSALIAADR